MVSAARAGAEIANASAKIEMVERMAWSFSLGALHL
jgi:hypothetical protein